MQSRSGYGELALQWIYEVENKTKDWESFYEHGMFRALDSNLAAALYRCIPRSHRLYRLIGEVRKTYESRKNEFGQPYPRLLKGRQILRLIYDYFEVSPTHHTLQQTQALLNISIKGSDLKRFHDDWLQCLDRQDHQPDWEFKLTNITKTYVIVHR